MEEFKTTVISYSKDGKPKKDPVFEDSKTSAIKQILLNQADDTILKTDDSLPTAQIQITQKISKTKKQGIEANPQFARIPKFYKKELHRHYLLVWLWVVLTALCVALESWALYAIIDNPTVNNWTALTLIPGLGLCVAFLILYANKYVNYKNEAAHVNFEGKPVTICVRKLYIRLKTAHINVNWFCGLFYVLGLFDIAACFLTAGFLTSSPEFNTWGILDPNVNTKLWEYGGYAMMIAAIVGIVTVFVSFFMHIFLLVTNHARAGKIDSYYSVQIVSDEELKEIKKHKNKRDMIIFFAIVMVLVLVGLLIYRIVKSKKVQNNVTITNV